MRNIRLGVAAGLVAACLALAVWVAAGRADLRDSQARSRWSLMTAVAAPDSADQGPERSDDPGAPQAGLGAERGLVCVGPTRDAALGEQVAEGGRLRDSVPLFRHEVPRSQDADRADRRLVGPAVATAGGRRAERQEDYHPREVVRAVRFERGGGLLVTARIDVGFTYQPARHQGGRMQVSNRSGLPVAISFHGLGCAQALLNGQAVQEGRSYLVVGDAEVEGGVPVGVHVRTPAGGQRESSPAGVG